MPNYGVAQAGSIPGTPPVTAGQGVAGQQGGFNVVSLIPGDGPYTLFNAESPTAPQSSVAFCRGPAPGNEMPAGIVFTISWAAAPTATLAIQGSNVDSDAQYQDLHISTTQQDYYLDLGNFAFYRAKLKTQSAGGAVTVIAKR